MKIEVCDNMVIVDGVPHVLISNNTGQDRVRQTIEIGDKMVEASAAPTPPPQPAAKPATPPPPPPPAKPKDEGGDGDSGGDADAGGDSA